MDQSYRKAVIAGVSPVEFWSLTPYQTRIAMEAAIERSDKQAWTIAAFQRSKKLPKFESLSHSKTPIKDGMELKKQLGTMEKRHK